MARRLLAMVVVLLPLVACGRTAPPLPSHRRVALRGDGGPSTSRDDLTRTIATLRRRVAEAPGNASAAVPLAGALLRQARVSGNAGLPREAEAALLAVLARDAGQYDARRLLAATYLAQHRFADALREAARCQAIRGGDAWLDGVIGDAHLERGEYDAAFEAFDRMAAARPDAAAYARVSYARELQGDLDGARRAMQLATEATSARDAESLAWHHAQLGHLYFELGRLAEARREYEQAAHVFPDHPFAVAGLARVEAALGHARAALDLVERTIASAPTPADFAFAGDLLAELGDAEAAERHYRLAEAAWQSDAPEPSRLARFLAMHGRRLADATALAESARADRNDIVTADALAWAEFQSGRLAEARRDIAEALRTGSRDRVIRFHAAAIAQASGAASRAATLVAQALDGLPRFDPIAAPQAAALRGALAAGAITTSESR